jgi:hypothetical protein
MTDSLVSTCIPLLSSAEAERLAVAIHAHRSEWRAQGGFFTLGAASYIEDPAVYPALAEGLRGTLWESFGWLYRRLASALSTHLSAPVEFSARHSLPGFHIWLGPAIFTTPKASVHFDLQYQRLRWEEGVSFERVVSFTLPLRLPAAGGGLNVWPVTWQQVQRFFERTRIGVPLDALTLLLRAERVSYQVGELFVHSGHLLHQIGEVPATVDGDERITLQGHGVLGTRGWLLYW